MTRLLRRSSWRHLARHPAQMGLAVAGVALGVAVVIGVDVASSSAGRAFTLSTEAVTGRATHQVVGGPAGVPEAVFPRLVQAGMTAAPVVEGWVEAPARPGAAGRALRLLGLDPFSEPPFRPAFAPGGETGGVAAADLAPLLARSGTCLLAAATAAELGVQPGGRLRVRVGGAARDLDLVGVLRPAVQSEAGALGDLVVMDVAAAQELLGRAGRLDRIDLLVPESGSARQLDSVRALLPPGTQLLEAGARAQSALAMTRAFRVNLAALSLLAMVCGAFLIYNTMTFSVVQRRTLLGTLRALGVTRREVVGLVLGEAVAVAAAGTMAGLAGGVLLARGLVGLVTQTINDLYFAVSVRELALSPVTLAKGVLLGFCATLLAALAPAVEATLAPPRAVLSRSAIEAGVRRALPRVTFLGGVMLLAGGGLLAVPGGGLVTSFAGLFGVVFGFALLSPAATVVLMRALRGPLGALLGVLGRMAAGGVVTSLSRTAVATAALVVAVAVTVGVGSMIDSFRSTVVRWLESSLRADVYVSAPIAASASGRGGLRSTALDPGLARRAAALPEVARVTTIRRVEVPAPQGPVRLAAVGTDRRGFAAFDLWRGDAARAWEAFAGGGAVLVSEPFYRRTGIGLAGRVRLVTELGERSFPVAGVFYDYASDRGQVLIARREYVAYWHDPALSGFSVDLVPGASVERAIGRLRRALGGGQALAIQSNRALKRRSLAVFDRTFRITGVLRLLAGLVAGIGVLSALTALQLERARELAVLRANGATPGQVWRLVITQTGLMGLAAGLISLPVGLTLSAIMIYVINRRSFGWTVRMEVSPRFLLATILLAVGTALVAGIYPSFRMARTRPALALREE